VVAKQGVGPMSFAEVEEDLLRYARRLAQSPPRAQGTRDAGPASGRGR
jgi:hypothetical protein